MPLRCDSTSRATGVPGTSESLDMREGCLCRCAGGPSWEVIGKEGAALSGDIRAFRDTSRWPLALRPRHNTSTSWPTDSTSSTLRTCPRLHGCVQLSGQGPLPRSKTSSKQQQQQVLLGDSSRCHYLCSSACHKHAGSAVLAHEDASGLQDGQKQDFDVSDVDPHPVWGRSRRCARGFGNR